MGICVLFLLLVVFGVLFYWCHGFFTHNEDIVPLKCGGGEPCSCTLESHALVLFFMFLGWFCTIFVTFDLFYLGY